jgi:hypothetical protein
MEKTQSWKKAKKRGDSPPSTACRVGGRLGTPDSKPEKDSTARLTTLWHVPLLFATDKHHNLLKRLRFKDSYRITNDFAAETEIDEQKSRQFSRAYQINPVHSLSMGLLQK